jgi:large subunit ribosomal protein L6
MSRVARMPVVLPAGVEFNLDGDMITVKGPMGTLSQRLNSLATISKDGSTLTFGAANESREAGAMSGTFRALVANMVQGVSKGFERKLTLIGVGYKAQVQGPVLNLALGFSHPVNHKMPEGVTCTTPTPTEIILKGADKQRVGQTAAEIRAYKPPEPYKGKGVRYHDETVAIKETKKK